MKGEGVYAYVILKQGVNLDEESIRNELKLLVKSKISGKQSDNNNIIKLTFYEIWYFVGFAIPEFILFTPGLPKTRSGKIMRRILRKIAANQMDDLGDISTLAEPEIVETIIQKHQKK